MKTVLFNVLSIAVVVVDQCSGSIIPPEYAAIAIAGINAILKILRSRK